jgi:flagellar basal-body rod modification protein FlgD
METTPLTQTSIAASQTGNATAANDSSVLSSDFETFLKMLTAQARYQDPLEPVDSTEYASQLAQFSAVEQQVKSNDLLSAIAGQLGTGNMAELAGWIGMDARTTAPVYVESSPITLFAKPAAVAEEAWLVVRDSAGEEVRRQQIPVSEDPFEWTPLSASGSPLAPGNYSFKVESRASGEVVLTEPAETYTRITEARTENGATVLLLNGGIAVTPSAISALREGI